MPVLTQLALVPIFYAWGKAHPELGASMGGVLGLGAAAYAVELCNFLLGMWLYRRIGYKVSILFMAHFDWKIIKETFRFGFFEMLGGMTVAAGVGAGDLDHPERAGELFRDLGQLDPGGEFPAGIYGIDQPFRRDHARNLRSAFQRV